MKTLKLPPAGLTVNVSVPDVCPSGFLTETGTEPAAAMSAAVIAAVTRVALTNVVVRVAPFQSTVAPETKLAPSTVRVKAADRESVVLGVRVVTVGRGV